MLENQVKLTPVLPLKKTLHNNQLCFMRLILQKYFILLFIFSYFQCKLTSLQEQAQMMSSDNERFHKYLQELAGHKRGLEQKVQDVDLQLQQAGMS